MHALQRLPTGYEGRKQQVAERAILEQERSQGLAVDRDIPQLTRDHRRQEDRLPGQQVHLPGESRRAMADALVAGRILDLHLALDDRDEGVALVADAEQHVANVSSALLSDLPKRRQLRLG